MAGRIDWAEFITKVYEAYDRKVNGMLYAALTGVGSSLPAGGQWTKSAPISAATKPVFDTLIEDVRAATGNDVVIMGTRSALGKLTGFDANLDWVSENMKDERYTTGRLGKYEGVTLFEIPQVFADGDTTRKLVDNTQLLIMPTTDNKFIKMYNEGESQIKETTDGNENMDKTIEYEFQTKMGVGVVIGKLFGVWTITTS